MSAPFTVPEVLKPVPPKQEAKTTPEQLLQQHIAYERQELTKRLDSVEKQVRGDYKRWSIILDSLVKQCGSLTVGVAQFAEEQGDIFHPEGVPFNAAVQTLVEQMQQHNITAVVRVFRLEHKTVLRLTLTANA
jgi:hypothetical protein